ncbi:MAG: nitrilase-related carbon-nitrogen hydrolase, partial [Aquiluna sp.]
MKLTIAERLASPANKKAPERGSLRVALVQFSWNQDQAAHQENIAQAVALAAQNGAEIVFLPELTLSRYPADTLPAGTPSESAEDLESGPTFN